MDNRSPLATETIERRPSLLFALPKGRLADESLELLQRAGLSVPVDTGSRKLVLPNADNSIGFVMAKPWDVPTFVEYGAADVGICGLDVLRESGRRVHEPLRLPFGFCRLSVAGPVDRPDTPLRYASQPRIATKFPRLTQEFFRKRGVNAEVIGLSGSVELGPVLALADLIVDLVETGDTLRANGLVEIRTILEVQAVLIVNRAAYQLKSREIQGLIERVRAVI
ncbi:MAG: ATP phosphoribosyltransferase [Caldilineaceae bacterium]|nr:ATP phosphoribosyltransferase [Caldilineaceae bacterium]